MEEKQKDINQVAMEVILNAGNGRDCIDQAFAFMSELQFEKARELLEKAEKMIIQAHVAQTKVIQAQVSGETTEYSLLFIHAQDTIMTINTELRLTQKMLPIMEAMNSKLLEREGDLHE